MVGRFDLEVRASKSSATDLGQSAIGVGLFRPMRMRQERETPRMLFTALPATEELRERTRELELLLNRLQGVIPARRPGLRGLPRPSRFDCVAMAAWRPPAWRRGFKGPGRVRVGHPTLNRSLQQWPSAAPLGHWPPLRGL
jgi:hypothetical protein